MVDTPSVSSIPRVIALLSAFALVHITSEFALAFATVTAPPASVAIALAAIAVILATFSFLSLFSRLGRLARFIATTFITRWFRFGSPG